MTTFAAPGKAVIWGEYAVLAGAPAMVMAVNRYALADAAREGDRWFLSSRGFESEASLDSQALANLEPKSASGVSAVVRAAVAALGDPALPAGMRIGTDTTDFYLNGVKLGIGSSAAVCTATCAALAEVLNQTFSETVALDTHRHLQGKAGSGLDVAAACTGGLLRFQAGSSRPTVWPEGWHYRFFWVGHAAKTTDHLTRFSRWLAAGNTSALDDLARAADELFASAELENLRRYVFSLKKLDENARLGIYTDSHARLDELASRAQVVYKPCGAGGGDIGIAVSDEPACLDTLSALATQDAFLSLNLEIAAHGLHRISS